MKCKHGRYACWDSKCEKNSSSSSSDTSSNIGQIGINTDGNLTVGLGGGLTMDATDGSVGVQIAPGVSYDF